MKTIEYFKSKIKGDVIALVAGIIMPFAFAPFRIFPLSVIGVGLLLCTVIYTTQKRALWRGWLFGIGEFGVGVSWVFVSIHQFGGVNIALSLIMTALFIAILSLCPAVACYALQRFFPENTLRKFIFVSPGIFLLFEWLRGNFFGGFPWLEAGYSQTDSPLQGLAPILGAYGISLVIYVTAGLFVYGCLHYKKHWKHSVIAVLMIWVISGLLIFIPWQSKVGKPLTVSLLQGNIAQSTKWAPDALDHSIKTYLDLTNDSWKSDLIIWPETAIPLANTEAQPLLDKLNIDAKKHNSGLLIGIPYQKGNKFYNALLGLGNASGVYLKRKLVPFGEFLPNIVFLKTLYKSLNMPIPDLKPGQFIQPHLKLGKLSIAAYICYEIAFPELVRNTLGDANLITVVSDDTWFGRSWAPIQHLQMAQMQAMSVARPILFDSNSGVTAIINADGIISNRIPTFKKAVLTGEVQPTSGRTLFTFFGTNLALLLAIIFIIIGLKGREGDKERMS